MRKIRNAVLKMKFTVSEGTHTLGVFVHPVSSESLNSLQHSLVGRVSSKKIGLLFSRSRSQELNHLE